MILFNIIQNNEKKAEEISTFLIEKQYTLQTHIDVNSIFNSHSKNKTIRVFFVTKALLYNTIEQEIKENFYSEDMIIYATPISHINEEYGEIIRLKVKSSKDV